MIYTLFVPLIAMRMQKNGNVRYLGCYDYVVGIKGHPVHSIV